MTENEEKGERGSEVEFETQSRNLDFRKSEIQEYSKYRHCNPTRNLG